MLDSTTGSTRVRIDSAEVEKLSSSQALILDSARTRPLYFDGRFLTAADLTRDQQYVRARQADLARAGGFGVVRGLMVATVGDGSGRRLRIGAGHGVTPAGETVLLTSDREVDLADIATIEKLDASFGLRKLPSAPAANRSGVFVLALRPVEFSANPIASYPTSLSGKRSVHDGDIVEAVAVSLIPYNINSASGESADARRARIAREIFVDGSTRGIPEEALPLAMIALERGVLQWLDVFIVRREVGSESPLQIALGATPRATREAWLLQYTRHLDAVLAARDATGQNRRFAAASYFNALPPAGPLPAAAIETGSGSDDALQYFFPASVDVELSFVPSDEIAALVEESLTLPAIDLQATEDELDSTAVLVLVPVPRPKLRELKASLTTVTRTLKAAAPGLLAKRKPLELLQLVRRPVLPTVIAPTPADNAWKQAFAAAADANHGQLWYLRRRNLAYRSELAGEALALAGDDNRLETLLDARVSELKLATALSRVRKQATSAANAEITSLLGNARVAGSDLLLQSAVNELKVASDEGAAIDQAKVLGVAQRYSDKKLGTGLDQLTAAEPELLDDSKLRTAIASSGVAPELDAQARSLSGTALKTYATQLAKAAADGPEAVRKLTVQR